MNKKNYITFSILAIAIAVATILSMTYFTGGGMQASAQIVPWFEADVPYAYVDLYQSAGNNTMAWDGVLVNGVFNFTITPNARELTGAVAQIEFYKIHIYSDQGSIINRTYSVAVCGRVPDPNSWNGYNYAITGSGGSGWYEFADGTTFDGGAIFGEGSGGTSMYNNLPDYPLQEFTIAPFSLYIADYDGEEAIEIISELRNTQTLYLEISKVGTVAYQLNSNSKPTIITLIEEEILYQLEFTKIDSGFVYKEFVEGSVGYPVHTPPATSLILSSMNVPFEVWIKNEPPMLYCPTGKKL